MSDMKKVIIRDKDSGEIHCVKDVALNSTKEQDYFDLAWEVAIADGDVEDFFRDFFSFEITSSSSFI